MLACQEHNYQGPRQQHKHTIEMDTSKSQSEQGQLIPAASSMFLITLPFSAVGTGAISPAQPVTEAASTNKPSTGKEERYFQNFKLPRQTSESKHHFKATFDTLWILSLDLQCDLTISYGEIKDIFQSFVIHAYFCQDQINQMVTFTAREKVTLVFLLHFCCFAKRHRLISLSHKGITNKIIRENLTLLIVLVAFSQ